MSVDTTAQLTQPQPVVAQCEGCKRTETVGSEVRCLVFLNPVYKWSVGACNMATHVQSEVVQSAKKLNPLKASKKAARGR